MAAVSTEFAPPFKLIAPYFLIGAISFLVSSVLFLGVDITSISHLSPITVSVVHFFLLSFIMMVIFGAMAQLVPVVLEVGHFAVDLYYIIYPLLFIGSILMALGFLFYPSLLPYGGTIVLISLLVFLFETFMTILKVKKINTVIKSVIVSNIFLFFGLIFGILMALTYAGQVSFDILSLLRAHIYLVFFGYVGITIMGISMVLLPMFWLSHSFSWKPIKIAISLMSIAVILEVISSIFDITIFEYFGYILALSSYLVYFYQIYIIYKTRVRIEEDIYKKSLIVSYSSLVVALVLAFFYLLTGYKNLILAFGWVSLIGFVTFLIIGHLYKIIPFLVWYQRFSLLVGKQKVPMLSDMVPKDNLMQFYFNLAGLVVATIGILINSNELFKGGVSFIIIGAIFALKNIIWMIRYK